MMTNKQQTQLKKMTPTGNTCLHHKPHLVLSSHVRALPKTKILRLIKLCLVNTFYQQITKFLPTKLMIKNKFLCHKVLLCHINFVKFVDQKIIHENQIIELILNVKVHYKRRGPGHE